ncbi:MAG TPA: CRTAC1 family protein [Planctomycetes bacterium]|nr:CRTAC1 family protein [Planctomycetota bacterium]
MNDDSKKKSRWPTIVFVVLALAAVGAAIVRVYWRTDDSIEIYEQIDLAIAELESGDFTDEGDPVGSLDRAISMFEELKRELPDELLPVRNLAVAHLLRFEVDREMQQARFEATSNAIEALLKRPDDKRVATLLGTRFLSKILELDPDQRTEKVVAMVDVVPRGDKDVLVQYALYQTASLALDADHQLVAHDALRRAQKAMPVNLYLLKLLLLDQQAARDPLIAQTLKDARPLIEPFRRSIELGENVDDSGIGFDSLEYIDTAIEAAENGDWETVSAKTLFLLNGVTTIEAHVRDADMLAPHPLDYILFRLSKDYRDANPMSPPISNPRSTEWKSGHLSDTLTQLENVRDVVRIDFDLDRRDEWIVLTDEQLLVFDSIDSDSNRKSTKIAAVGTNIQWSMPTNGHSILVADLDYDEDQIPAALRDSFNPYFHADVDVIVYGPSGVTVLENTYLWAGASRNSTDTNNSSGGSSKATSSSKTSESGKRELVEKIQTGGLDQVRGVRSAILVDIDHDKDLDIVLVADGGFQAWLNRGNLDFMDATSWSIFPDVGDRQVGLYAVDWDRDADVDIIVACERWGTGILENMRHGQVVWDRFEGPFPQRGKDFITVFESDGNVSWDFAAAGESLHVVRTVSPGARRPTPLDSRELSTSRHLGVISADINNDSAVDLVVFNEKKLEVAFGRGDGRFEPLSDLGPSGNRLESAQLVDVNADGWLDVVLIDSGKLVVFINQQLGKGHWLKLKAVGQTDNAGHAGHTGIGTLVEIMSGGRYQASVVQGQTTHFGLGDDQTADVVRIIWTNGVPQSVIQPKANQVLVEKMTLKGSCPYVYTWVDGRYQFHTDCLWAAPIGLQAADGVMMPSRSWEYLRIPGEQLTADNGLYRILLTEELWEAAYFDHVRLIAIDHLIGTEVYSNEKVGPAAIANYQLHTVRTRLVPRAASDKHGRDVSDLIRHEDEKYFAGWDRRIRQGVTDEHFLELDLGDLGAAKTTTLFLRGWIYPTDTSLNVAFSQNPEIDAPEMPSIWVLDEAGDSWVEALPFIGFPGGKTKTIAVDISSIFRNLRDFRLRVVTSGEVYWDTAFFTVDEEPVELREQVCGLATAELRYGGFSASLPRNPHAPERYDFSARSPDPRWPPMRGHFTRYGDVTHIVEQADDRMAVLGSGDELELLFHADVAKLPVGWTRDFILHSVGWDKDADLNTVHGQSVEPLPYRDMQSYPYQFSGRFPEGPEHERYLREDQTRQSDRMRFWRHLPRTYGRKR